MVAPRKKKGKTKPTKTDIFTWTTKRKLAAKVLSESTESHEIIAKQVGICRDTLYNWRQEPVFMDEVARLILKQETFSLAGLLKACKKGLEIKESYIDDDKNTYLDYIKEIADMQGYKKQKIELEGNVNHTGGVVIYIPEDGRDPETAGN